jgi:hypothetical protein
VRIDNWKRLGIQTITDEIHKGWYIIFKKKSANNFFEKYAEIVGEHYNDEQIRIRDYPYIIIECKVTIEVFLTGEISNDSDYVLRKTHEFSNFDDMLHFLKSKKCREDDFVWLVDLQYIE